MRARVSRAGADLHEPRTAAGPLGKARGDLGEERTDDVRAVMDATGSERAALLGVSEGRRSARCSRRRTPSERSRS